MLIRTDLALESREAIAEKGDTSDGIIINEENFNGIITTDIRITTDSAAKRMARPIGRYVTIEFGRVWQHEYADFKRTADLVSDKLSSLLEEAGCAEQTEGALVVGLGNRSITADAVGPRVVDNVIVTHHLQEGDKSLCSTLGLRDVAGITPGVLGQTGVESADIVKAIVQKTRPKAVIIIDALASRQLARLATTVQLSNTGISPGSGVGNHRTALNREQLGVPVISIGIPTVVDVATLVYDVAESMGNSGLSQGAISNYLKSEDLNFFVTPKETDAITNEAAKIISCAINRSLHGEMSYEEMVRFS